MSAVFRVYWTFFTGVPIQRWLGGLGLIGLLFAAIATVARPGGAIGWPEGLLFLGVLTVIPAVSAAGGLLRSLAAPMNHQLFPKLRLQLLAATLMFCVTTSAFTGILLWAFGFGPENSAPALQETLIYSAAALSLAILIVFFAAGRRASWARLEIVLVVVFLQWLSAGGPEALRAMGVPLETVTLALTVIAWLVFGRWFLRVRRIQPFAAFPVDRADFAWMHELGSAPTKNAAIRALLAAYVESSYVRQLLMAIGIGAAIALLVALLGYLPGQTLRPPLLTSFIWSFFAMTAAFLAVYPRVPQARLLWLRVPGPRLRVFARVQANIARLITKGAAMVGTIAALAPALFGAAHSEAVWGAALMISAMLYSICLVLASVRGIKLAATWFIAMLIGQFIVLGPLDSPAPQPPLAGVVMHLGGAAIFWCVAWYRWRSIDWMRFRPMHSSSRSSDGFA